MSENNNLETLLEQGHLDLERGQYETALATFEGADSLYPDLAQVKYALGLANLGLEQYEAALECFDKALAINPDYQPAKEQREKLLSEAYNQRTQAYLQLIDALLQCPDGEENEILAAKEHLIDAGLIQTIEQVAAEFDKEGSSNGDWLRNLAQDLAQYLQNHQPSQAHLDFLLEILQTIDSGGKEEQVYTLLQQNLHLVDANLAQALQIWSGNTLKNLELKEKKSIGYDLGNFSNFIQNFPLGNRANNIEIAISGYQILLTIFTKADFSQKWAITQNCLGVAYRERIAGDRRDNLETAIICHQKALRIFQAASSFRIFTEAWQNWAITQNCLGNAYQERIAGVKRKNLEQAINCYQAALIVYTEEDFPQDWAATQSNLGVAYCKRIAGDRKENLETAINYFNAALKVYTEADFPQDWAWTQNNLGLAYRKRIAGDRKENLETAINYFNAALKVYTEADFPQDWAWTQHNLGIAYSDRITGDGKENLETAINYFNAALRVYTEADFPQDWARTQNNLGAAYNDNRIAGDRKENLETAITCSQAALRVTTEADFPQDWAWTQNNLGTGYYKRIAGDRKENLETAINYFNAALRVTTEDDFPQDWAKTQNNLGNAYSDRIAGDRRENLEQAINCYQAALRVTTEDDFPQDWAKTQNNLGNAYSDNRIAGDRRENLEQAINCYQAALRVTTEADFPYEWARTQNNLANAYKDRIAGDRKENLETAINYFNAALRVYTEADFPQDWAKIQHNLANAYRERIAEDRKENLEQAINCYQAALRVRTEADFPYDWAGTQNSLGNAYSYRIAGDRRENLEQAINCYQAALRVRTEADFPYDWARTQNNLANAYSNRIEDLETAINCYQAALRVSTKADFPYEWARTQNNLGAAYKDRIAGVKRENLETAINCYQAALRVSTKADFPQDWAETQNNLANAYRERIAGVKRENLETAINCYQDALNIYTPKSDPTNCLVTARNLGNLAFYQQEDWQLAIDSYSLAIAAVEQSREWGNDDQRKQEILSESIGVYQNIVQACINLNQIDKAIEYVERSKARNLVDLLANRDLYPKRDIPQQVITRLDYLRRQITTEERILRQQSNFYSSGNRDNRRFTSTTSQDNQASDRTHLNQLRQELENLLTEDIKSIDPGFELTQRVEPISFTQMQDSLATPQTVLIEWYLGSETLSAFIVTSQQQTPVHIPYTTEQLEALINTASEYLDTYLQRDDQWQGKLSNLLSQLAKNLQLETIIQQIKEIIPDFNQLILVPHRWLHLLPLHALPLSNGRCLLDLFPQGVSYAPSVQLLELTRKQSKPQLTNFFAVQNPTVDLDFTDFEVQTIRPQFRPHDDILKRTNAEKTALTPERLGKANCAHFSCHGYFNFENPELSALLLAGSQIYKVKQEEKSKTRFLPAINGGSIDLNKCLTLGEIFELDLRQSRLVTLSACETGLTDFKSLSDEYIGLPSGFLYAGSPNVVSSLWAVNDLSTAFLMIKLYQNLKEKEIDSVPIALNQAQLWLKNVTKEKLQEWGETLNLKAANQARFETVMAKYEANSRPFASPYYWAAFCAVGC